MSYIRALCFGLLILPAASANAQTFESADKPPVIIELFTSEGCSSCPPAENWLNKLTENHDLWHRYFALAWHVDYWDSLGWPDRFANRRYSHRQRLYMVQTPLKSVYTPGMLVNGRAWRGWIYSRLPQARAHTEVGRLKVELQQQLFHATFVPAAKDDKQSYELHVAVLGFGLTTQVHRGENAGRSLQHEFVVLAQKKSGDAKTHWSGELPPLSAHVPNTTRRAAVFWLERPGSPVPLQMTGGWIAQ